jgi:hypothetical protein
MRRARTTPCIPIDARPHEAERTHMNSQMTGLRVAGSVFGLMAVAQLLRLILQPIVIVAGHTVPLWPSILAFLILASLCLWLLNLTRAHL